MVNMPRASSSSDPAPSASRSLDDPEDDPEEDNPLENIESEAVLRRTTATTTTSTRRRNRPEDTELSRLTGAIADTRSMLERFIESQSSMFRAANDMRENYIQYVANIIRNVDEENFVWMRWYIEDGVRCVNARMQKSQASQQVSQQAGTSQLHATTVTATSSVTGHLQHL